MSAHAFQRRLVIEHHGHEHRAGLQRIPLDIALSGDLTVWHFSQQLLETVAKLHWT